MHGNSTWREEKKYISDKTKNTHRFNETHNSRSLNCISATCVKTAGNSGIELSLMELREGQRTQSDMVYSAELNLILIWGLIADKLSNKGVRTLWLHTQRKRERHCCTFIRSCSVLNTAGFFVLLLSCIFVLVLSKYLSSFNCLVIIVHKLFSNNKCSPESP